MFKKKNIQTNAEKQAEFEAARLKYENDIKLKAKASRMEATELALSALDRNGVEIMLTPFIPFHTLQRMLGLIWMSGCWMGLAIMFASWGGLAWAFFCFCMICLSIFFLVSAMLTYLDA